MKAWELIKALEEGEKLTRVKGEGDKPREWFSLKYNSTEIMPSACLLSIVYNPEEWEIYTEPRWEDNIPECGVPCFVGDKPVVITEYDELMNHPYGTAGDDCFRSARRMTKSEIQQWIDNAPEE